MTDTAEANGTDTAAVEEKASSMGWVPKEDFKGNPDDWRDAQAFVNYGETESRRLKREKGELETRLEAAERNNAATKKSVEEFKVYHEKTEERAYQRAMKELQAKQRDAVEAQDTDAYDKAQKEIDGLDKPEKPESKPAEGADHPEWTAWVAKNPWFTGQGVTEMRAAARCDEIADVVASRHPMLRGADLFDKIKEVIEDEFPALFENPRRSQAGAVEDPGDTTRKQAGKQSYENLPPDAKAACDDFVAQGHLTREQYCKDYEWE